MSTDSSHHRTVCWYYTLEATASEGKTSVEAEASFETRNITPGVGKGATSRRSEFPCEPTLLRRREIKKRRRS